MLRYVTGLQLHVYMNLYWIINWCVWSWFNVISTERHSQLVGICVIKQVLFCLIMHMFSNMFCLSMVCWVNDSNLYNSYRTSSLYVNNVIVRINNHNIVWLLIITTVELFERFASINHTVHSTLVITYV